MSGRHTAGPGDGRPDDQDAAVWWASLTEDALADETRTNRRRERWLLLAAPVALAATALVLVLHGGPGVS
jgi:hypothetical protein